MKETAFFKLRHVLGSNHIASKRASVNKYYRPDLTIADSINTVRMIIELESSTSRKGLVGAVIKAEKYSVDLGCRPLLIIVLHQRTNTTIDSVGEQIRHYFQWIKSMRLRGYGLCKVAIIADKEYRASCEKGEVIGSDSFLSRCRICA